MNYVMMADEIAHVEQTGSELLLHDAQSAMDLIGNAWSIEGCKKLIVKKEAVSEEFFDLKTRIAGEALQKFSNYRFRLAIVGDFSGYTSKSLKDFIYESNKGRVIHFVSTMEDAVAALSQG